MNFPKNPNVQLLAKTFDLALPKYYLVVTDYTLESGAICINTMKIFDSKGVFIRFVKNELVLEHMHKYPISFEKLK